LGEYGRFGLGCQVPGQPIGPRHTPETDAPAAPPAMTCVCFLLRPHRHVEGVNLRPGDDQHICRLQAFEEPPRQGPIPGDEFWIYTTQKVDPGLR